MENQNIISYGGRQSGKTHRMRQFIYYYMIAMFMIVLASCGKDNDPAPAYTDTTTVVTIDPHDTMVKFTLYSKRVPYIWKRVVNTVWVQDTIKTNNAIVYENYDKRNFGIGYWVTMNLAGIPSDSLHIIGEYKGKSTQMASLYHQSAAYVLLDAVKP